MDIMVCSEKDIPLLAKMNKMLIEDEKAETVLDLNGLEKRMREFLSGEYTAYLFAENGETVGYSLLNEKKSPVYLRQFFICRDKRRKGYGRKAIELLLATLDIGIIDVDVYSWNVSGIKFWQSLGFETRCYNMRYTKRAPV